MNSLENIKEPRAIEGIMADTLAHGFDMASDSLTCSLLRVLAASKNSAQFLEIGSGTGLSTAWLLDGMDSGSHLTTIDYDETLLSILKRHLGKDPRLTVVCADGEQYLSLLRGQQFDLIFADAWAGKYHMLERALDLLAPSGIYIVDDMLPRPSWPEGHAQKAAKLVSTLEQREEFHVTKLSWASGVIIATKR